MENDVNKEIKDLMALNGELGQDCHAADIIAKAQLEKVRARISRLQQLEAELERITHLCEGGSGGTCKVLGALGDHSLCIGDHD